MLLKLLHDLSVYSVFIPGLVGLVRYHSMPPGYRPFLFFVLLGIFGDTTSQILIHYFHNNLAFGNCYTLAEFLVLLLFFHKWSSRRQKKYDLLVMLAGIAIWVIDNILWHGIGKSNAIFRVAYSLIITWESAILLARIVSQKKTLSFKDPLILSTFSLLLYFSFKAFIQVFLTAGSLFTSQFRNHIYVIHTCINLIANVLYTTVFLCMPKKQMFSISSS